MKPRDYSWFHEPVGITRRIVVMCLSAFLLVGMAAPTAAYAYGSEGMFGGRPRPDYAVDFGNAAPPDTSRPERAQPVLERPRPDYDPVPLTYGSFAFYPSLEMGVAYDSNIYGTRNATSDGVGEIRPVVSGMSNWGRHEVSFVTYGDLNYFADHSDENFSNAVFDLRGRYDVLAQTWVSAHGGIEHLSEPRSSADNAGGSEPGAFNVYSFGASGYRGAGLIKAALDYDFKRFDFSDVTTPTGASLSQDGRDRNQNSLDMKVTYDADGMVAPYLRAGGNWRGYDVTTTRDSAGGHVDVGAVMDFGGMTSVDAYIGWLGQNYADFGSAEMNSGFDFGAQVDWNVTGLTSVAFEANRSIEETTLAGFNSTMNSGASVTVTHELLRNVLLEGGLNYTNIAYNGVGSRTDNVYGFDMGGRYLLNRHVYGDLVYNYSDRVSTNGAANLRDHLIRFRVGARL